MYTKTRFTLTDGVDYQMIIASHEGPEVAVNIYGSRRMHQTVYLDLNDQVRILRGIADKNPDLILDMIKVSET